MPVRILDYTRIEFRKNLWASLFAIAIFGLVQQAAAADLPPCTLVPVVFVHTLNGAALKPGDSFAVKTMQVVAAGEERIPRGSRIMGHVVPGNDAGGNSALAFRFDRIRVGNRDLPVTLSLRAMANFVAVNDVVAASEVFDDTPETPLIGGGIAYTGDTVYLKGQAVGRSDGEGIFTRVERRNSNEACGDTHEIQSTGIFSADANGLYGFSALSLDNSGAADGGGIIQLHSEKRSVKIPGGSAALLEVTAAGR